jgi:hypothetical protein
MAGIAPPPRAHGKALLPGPAAFGVREPNNVGPSASRRSTADPGLTGFGSNGGNMWPPYLPVPATLEAAAMAGDLNIVLARIIVNTLPLLS